jgi:pyruvate/2-oxoglutarate dehydrogenase complex dihydrolipoamide dehydrogenase (E3) component
MRAELGSTEADMKAFLKKMQGEFAQAKKIIVVGGGPVGLEIAGVSRLLSRITGRS